MFATCRCTVCSLSTSDAGDLSVREACGDETQHLGLTATERRVSVRRMRRVVVEEPGERALDLTLVVDVRQVRVTAQRDEACVRKKRRELAPSC